MPKTIIIANRLPVKLSAEDGNYAFKATEGGLATGLGSVYKQGNNVWIGWPGNIVEEDQQEKIKEELKQENLLPVFLTQEEVNNFYEGFSNETLWPIFHYMPTYAKFEQACWQSYVEVNKKFSKAVLEILEPGDIVWIHDYQLLLLPSLIREAKHDASIGFFQHIPFPSYEIFRLIPWRRELINGIVGADLIGFHTYDDARHFLSTATHLTGYRSSSNVISTEERSVVVESFPMGIDNEKFESALQEISVKNNIESLQKVFSSSKLILSIDRLDYSKGILQRLAAFEHFLQKHPEYAEKVTLYMIVVPSRDTVPQYKELRDNIDMLVGNINGSYRTISWTPIQYFYKSFPFEMLVALYHMADICLVTPMRDGMNLVCKEYVAARIKENGVLILSEMAGAAKELVDSIIVNPNNVDDISNALWDALNMPLFEQERRMRQLRYIVQKFNINQWVKIFMERLKEVKEFQRSMEAKFVGYNTERLIIERYQNSAQRILFLDYDGTLVGFHVNISMAYPDEELYKILEDITADPSNKVVIISGRNYQTLQDWFGHMNIDMIAEHGAWYKKNSNPWEHVQGLNDQWKKDVLPVLNTYTDRTPGTFIEEKSYSLVWHYRKADEGLGELRATELTNNLRYLVADQGLQLLHGNKVIEIKSSEINKGKAVNMWMQENNPDMTIAIGDDYTDEDIFKALPENAITIKVGSHISAAKYYVNRHMEVRRLLKALISSTKQISTEERNPSEPTRPFNSEIDQQVNT
jgi:trehalose 6-phosphate synthase/phosphatase